jgi:hypothetical protein
VAEATSPNIGTHDLSSFNSDFSYFHKKDVSYSLLHVSAFDRHYQEGAHETYYILKPNGAIFLRKYVSKNDIICSYCVLLTYLLHRFSASQEIPRVLWNPKVNFRIQKSPPPTPILSRLDPDYMFRQSTAIIREEHLKHITF